MTIAPMSFAERAAKFDRLTLDQLLEKFSDEVHDKIREMLAEADGGVYYEHAEIYSGPRDLRPNVLGFGASDRFTCKTAAEVLEKFPRLHTELASTTVWPRYIYEKEAAGAKKV